MKQNSTLKTLATGLLIAVAFLLSHKSQAQNPNRLNNSTFDAGTISWVLNGILAETNPETVYGGSVGSNKAAEIDLLVGLRQKAPIVAGQTYKLSYKASRRTSRTTPSNVGITIRMIGDVTGTNYLNFNKSYSNTTFGFVQESASFTIPANSPDNTMILEIVSFNNATTYGVIVDDVQMMQTSASSLPVQWVGFSAELRNGQTILNWKTAAEINNKYFVVERAGQDNKFDSIGTVFSNTSHRYSFTDAKLNDGTNFYRIRQVDIDASASFSKILSVNAGKGNGTVKIFPTVANSTINVNLSSERNSIAQITVVDASGRMMSNTQKSLSSGVNQQSIDISSLNNGIYYFHIHNTDGSINHTQVFHKVN